MGSTKTSICPEVRLGKGLTPTHLPQAKGTVPYALPRGSFPGHHWLKIRFLLPETGNTNEEQFGVLEVKTEIQLECAEFEISKRHGGRMSKGSCMSGYYEALGNENAIHRKLLEGLPSFFPPLQTTRPEKMPQFIESKMPRILKPMTKKKNCYQNLTQY